MNRINVLGLNFINTGILEAVEHAVRTADEHRSAYIVCPGSEMMLEARKNKRLMAAISEADMILPEGNGIIYASHILGMPVRERISGVDFASALMARLSEKHKSIFIIGKDEDTVDLVEENISRRYPGLRIVGRDDGYYHDDNDVIEQINSASPDLILIGRKTARQEIWMYRNKSQLDCGLMLGIGEGMDVFAGIVARAPKRWRDSGFEWLYWLVKDPRLFRRFLKRMGIVQAALKRRLFGA